VQRPVESGEGDGVSAYVEVDAGVAAFDVAEVLVGAAQQCHERALVADGDRGRDRRCLLAVVRAVGHRLRPLRAVRHLLPK
jgi:hypothetical protein